LIDINGERVNPATCRQTGIAKTRVSRPLFAYLIIVRRTQIRAKTPFKAAWLFMSTWHDGGPFRLARFGIGAVDLQIVPPGWIVFDKSTPNELQRRSHELK
jgi:hypothetical protein